MVVGQACLTSGVQATPLSPSLRTAGALGVVTLHSGPPCCVPGRRESQGDSPALGTIAQTGLKSSGTPELTQLRTPDPFWLLLAWTGSQTSQR